MTDDNGEHRYFMKQDGVPDEVLDSVIMWPEGTRGFHEERQVLRMLNRLCKQMGYGRLPQMTAAIEEVWRGGDPAVAKYARMRQEHLDSVEAVQKGDLDA